MPLRASAPGETVYITELGRFFSGSPTLATTAPSIAARAFAFRTAFRADEGAILRIFRLTASTI